MKFIKKFKIVLIIAALIALSAIYFVLGKKDKVEYTTVAVERRNLIQTISEVGMVRAAKEIELDFLQNGKIGNMPVKIGDKIKQGQILAELDYSSLVIKEQEAQANLDVANANLNKVLAGATLPEIAVNQAQVDQAKAVYLSSLEESEKVKNKVAEDISQAEKNLADLESSGLDNLTAYEQSITNAENNLENVKNTYLQSVDNKENVALTTIDNKLVIADTALDHISTILNDEDAKGPLEAKDKIYLSNTKSSYNSSLALLALADNSLSTAQGTQDSHNIISASQACINALNEVFKSLDYCYKALANSIVTFNFSQDDLDTYKTDISAQITAIGTAITEVQTAQHNLEDAVLTYQTKVVESEDSLTKVRVNLEDAIKSSKNTVASLRVSGDQQITVAQAKVDANFEAWQIAKAQLTQLKSAARVQDISLYQAQVKQAEAVLNLAKNQIEDSILKAPIDGTVVRIAYEVGEQVSADRPVIAVLGENNLEIEVDISEADISKIKKGNPAKISFDALGNETKFTGEVYSIEPAETIIQDVIYYKVKVQFNAEEKEKIADIKSGMTANVVISANYRNNVLLAPARAIIEKNGDDKYVRLLINNKVVELPVETGLRGDEGLVEVVSGIKEGDKVITFEKPAK